MMLAFQGVVPRLVETYSNLRDISRRVSFEAEAGADSGKLGRPL